MRVQYLTWSGFRVTIDNGLVVVFDPYLSGAPEGGAPPSPVQVDDFGRVDFVVVTHSTEDHFGAAVELVDRYGCKLVGNKDVAIIAAEHGCPAKNITRMSAGGWFTYEGLWLKGIQAHHISMRKGANGSWISGPPLSYFMRDASGTTLFHGGDTSLHGDMGLYGELYPPDVCMLTIGKLTNVMKPSKGFIKGGVLPPNEAGVACRLLGARNAIPMHYVPETGLGEEFCEEVRQRSPQTTPIIMKPGEEREFVAASSLVGVA